MTHQGSFMTWPCRSNSAFLFGDVGHEMLDKPSWTNACGHLDALGSRWRCTRYLEGYCSEYDGSFGSITSSVYIIRVLFFCISSSRLSLLVSPSCRVVRTRSHECCYDSTDVKYRYDTVIWYFKVFYRHFIFAAVPFYHPTAFMAKAKINF